MSDRPDEPNAPAAPAAVEVRDVVKRFGRRTVLDGADLRVEPGEFVVLGGPSGVGKSTLLQLIAALDVPDHGTISVNGRPVGHHHGESRFRRRPSASCSSSTTSSPASPPARTSSSPCSAPGCRATERVERADELLELLGLADWSRSRPATMSGGERQRVAIARALANRPSVLLADEPTGNLDDASAAVVTRVLRKLSDEDGVAVLAVSHDERLDRLADQRLTLDAGRIAEWTPS